MPAQDQDLLRLLLAKGGKSHWQGRCWLCDVESEQLADQLLFTKANAKPPAKPGGSREIGPTDQWFICNQCANTIQRLIEQVGPRIEFVVKEFK